MRTQPNVIVPAHLCDVFTSHQMESQHACANAAKGAVFSNQKARFDPNIKRQNLQRVNFPGKWVGEVFRLLLRASL